MVEEKTAYTAQILTVNFHGFLPSHIKGWIAMEHTQEEKRRGRMRQSPMTREEVRVSGREHKKRVASEPAAKTVARVHITPPYWPAP